jgi:hypothetical protein
MLPEFLRPRKSTWVAVSLFLLGSVFIIVVYILFGDYLPLPLILLFEAIIWFMWVVTFIPLEFLERLNIDTISGQDGIGGPTPVAIIVMLVSLGLIYYLLVSLVRLGYKSLVNRSSSLSQEQ